MFMSNVCVCQSCLVEGADEGEERVTFLYKFVDGVCPRSYGFNVAGMAGVPEEVVGLARVKAAQFESTATELQAFRCVCVCVCVFVCVYIFVLQENVLSYHDNTNCGLTTCIQLFVVLILQSFNLSCNYVSMQHYQYSARFGPM